MHAIRNLAFSASIIAVMALFAPACQTTPAAASKVDPTGSYALVAVDGKAVPAKVEHEGASLEVLSGAFVIAANATCSSKTVFVAPNGAKVTREVDATYTQDGAHLTMQWKGAGTTTGVVEGSTFTMDNEGMLFVYRK